MVMTYRRPGVYLEESLLVNPADTAGTITVAAFVGVAQKGPVNEPTLVESWSSFVSLFGDFSPITVPPPVLNVTERMVPPPPQTLALLKTDVVYGDGRYVGPDFEPGQYILTGDALKAHYLMPAKATNRGAVVQGTMYAADPDVTASDATNAAKLKGRQEVQTLTGGGTMSGGTYQITIYGLQTGNIAYNAAPAVIQTAINAVVTSASDQPVVTGGAAGVSTIGTPVLLTFPLGKGDVTPVTVQSAITGTAPTVTVATSIGGLTSEGFVASPATAWTTGQAFWVGGYPFYWDGTNWQPGKVGGGTVNANNGAWALNAYPGTPVSKLPPVLSYLPYAVYSFFQNGGRFAWIIRAVDDESEGSYAVIAINGADTTESSLQSFKLVARSVGNWGNNLKYQLVTRETILTDPADPQDIFNLQIIVNNEVVETWQNLSVRGSIAGTRRIDSALNDAANGAGSAYVRCIELNSDQPQPVQTDTAVAFTGGIDPGVPGPDGLVSAAQEQVPRLEGPVTVNLVGYLEDARKQDSLDASSSWVSATLSSASFPDRQDIFVVNDCTPPRDPGASAGSYKTKMMSYLSQYTGDSYSASYGPWIIVPNPAAVGSTVSIPPGGGVIGMMARIDATVGVFRAPAGVIAGISNAVGVQTKFSDSDLGDLNAANINVIRSVVGAGICCMGGRTRKTYGTDRYVSARRTLIYIKEVMRRSTQFAVFENNDLRLWTALRMSAERVLRPLWEQGGLRGSTAQQAYFIRCDATLNTSAVIQSGEVRMELGVALEYPAEFVIIRVTQFDQGTFATEVVPTS